ncbi:MAG: hypothetical protein IJB89_00270 [Akkermansia sp.]|nr:hypothetical protein [Akkermansia sp.]
MLNSWYAELSGVHYKLGQWWVPEREEKGILLYRGTRERPPGAVQKLTKEQEKLFYEADEDWYYALAHSEWKADSPDYIITLYRDGKEVGVQREYFGKQVRVLRRYMFADYESAFAARKAACYDDEFRDFLRKYL